MKSVRNLFDRVIVDISTVKFFNNGSFPGFVDLVRKGGSFIFPSEFQFMGFGEENDFGPFKLTVSERKQNAYEVSTNECFTAFYKQFGEAKDQRDLQNSIVNCTEYKNWEAQLDPPIEEPLQRNIQLIYGYRTFYFIMLKLKRGSHPLVMRKNRRLHAKRQKAHCRNNLIKLRSTMMNPILTAVIRIEHTLTPRIGNNI